MQPFTGRIALAEGAGHPLCPSCGLPLARLHWHKVRGGPPLAYVVILSCGGCGALFDLLAGGGGDAVAGA